MKLLLAPLTLLLASVLLCGVDAQLTPPQQDLRQQAMQEASQLLFGSRSAVGGLGPGEELMFNLTTSRLEAQLNKQAAIQQWAGVPAPPFPQPTSRKILEASAGNEVTTQTVSRQLLSFNAHSSCRVYPHHRVFGKPIPHGYLRNTTYWGDCCAACAARADCGAWGVNVRQGSRGYGCLLRAQGSTMRPHKKFFIAGTLRTLRDLPSIPAPSPNNSPPPSPTPPSPVPASVPTGPSVPLPSGSQKYADVLALHWQFSEAQRSGPTPSWNSVPWRWDSHLDDVVVGGWYDAGDFLKLNFPLSSTVGLLAFGISEFADGYNSAGQMQTALNNVHIAADYLLRCHDTVNQVYIGQIGDPNIDHQYWGRPEQEKTKRPGYKYTPGMGASDLYGNVAGALAAFSTVYRTTNSSWADTALASALELYSWGQNNPGRYSDYYKKQTYSIYPSSQYLDKMAWAAGWLYVATGNTSYLYDAQSYWNQAGSGNVDVYPGWDSMWAPHALHMYSLIQQGVNVPGSNDYVNYIEKVFLRAWLVADGYQQIVSTPMGLIYPSWNEWANLQFATTVSSLVAVHAKYTNDSNARAADLAYVQSQIDYCLGNGPRSFTVGYGSNSPQQPQHAAASCPDMPARCDWNAFSNPGPNPQTIYGGLVGGPMGQRKDAKNPDYTYYDKRSDYISNEVANDYNAGFAGALAALLQLLN